MQEMITPDDASPRAVLAYAKAMREMLRIGWPKEMIPELERLWWSLRDANGKLTGGAEPSRRER